MNDFSPEIDCKCHRLIHVEWDERGEIVRCLDCGSRYVSTSDDLVWIEGTPA